MKNYNRALLLVGSICALASSLQIVHSQEKAGTVQVHMVVTDQTFDDSNEIPPLTGQNVQVKQGKKDLRVEHVIPARDDSAALQVIILIDDTCDSSIGNNLNDIREFINAQPASTVVGVAYMSNATVQITQNFTADHALAAKAIRLPRGNSSAMDSPYLSLISLVKGWPVQKLRREVLMVSDGIDRLRGDNTGNPGGDFSPMGPSGRGQQPFPSMSSTTMPSISSDADTASTASQQAGVIVHSIYSPGVGRLGRNGWEAQLGQSGVAKIADETGGEYFALGTQSAVSFKPYLERLQRIFDNQYFLVFQAIPGKKDGLQRVRISTQLQNVDFASADNVWVPANGK